MTLWVTMMHHHTKFHEERFGSEDVRINNPRGFGPSLRPWPWTEDRNPTFSNDTTGHDMMHQHSKFGCIWFSGLQDICWTKMRHAADRQTTGFQYTPHPNYVKGKCIERMKGDVAQWLVSQKSNLKTLGSIPRWGKVRNSFSVLPGQLLCRHVCAWPPFVCTAHTQSCVCAQVKDPISICCKRVGLTASGMVTQKYCIR